MLSKRNHSIPQLSHISAFLLSLILIGTVVAQQELLSDIKFWPSNNNKAGDIAVYRFTIRVPDAGDLIRTYFPASVEYQGNLDVCQERRDFAETSPIQNCEYFEATNMVDFILPGHVDRGSFFTYEIGQWKNPGYSQSLGGFDLQVLDSGAPDTILYQKTDAQVTVKTGAITAQSLQTDSEEVAAKSNFEFMFTVTNPVPNGGFIEISFPLAHFEVPNAQDIEIRMSVGGGSWDTQDADQVVILQSGIKFQVPDQGIEADGVVGLEIKNMQNPNTMEETDSFVVTTLTAASEKIDTASTGFVVQMKDPAEITVKVFQVDPRNLEVGQMTQVTVSLDLPTVYEAEGYLTMTLPETVEIMPQNFYCNFYIGFMSNDQEGTCSLVPNTSNKVIRIDQSISAKQITFGVIMLVNPPHTKETDDFVFHIYDAMNNMIAQTSEFTQMRYTPVPGPLISVDITRPDPTVGFKAAGQSAAFEFTVVTKNMLQSGEIIEFKIPYTQFALIDDGQTMECRTRSSVSAELMAETCTVVLVNSEYFLLRYPVYCSQMCATQATFELQVGAGIQNPTWIPSSTDSIEVTSYTSDLDYKIDSRTSNVLASPSLEEGSISDMLFVKTPGLVGALTDFTLEMRTLNLIPIEGYMKIYIQDDSLQLGDSSSIFCKDQDGTSFACEAQTHASGLISSITIREPCGPNTECPSAHQLTFSVSGIRNPRSTKQIPNDFSVSTFTVEGFPIDKGEFQANDLSDLELQPAFFLDVTLVAPDSQADIVTGKVETNYEIRVHLSNGLIAEKGRLSIAFPEQVSIQSGTTECTAYEEVSMDLLSCTVEADQVPQIVTVSHSVVSTDYFGESIMVKLQNSVSNPPSTQSSDSFQIETELLDSESGVYYSVDWPQAEDKISVTSNKANTFESVTIERSIAEVSIETDLQLCIKPRNPVPANSQLTIVYPEDQAVISGQQTYSAQISYLEILVSEPQKTVIVLPDAIGKSEEYCIEVTNGIENPGKTSPPQNSFQLTLQTQDGYYIDQTLAGIFAQPLLSAGPFLSVEIQSFGTVVGDDTSLEAELVLKSPLPSGSQFFIKLPDSVFYESGQQIECAVDQSSYTQCVDLVTQDDMIGSYISSMRLSSSQTFTAGDRVTLKVRNLSNKFDTRSLAANELQVLLQSYDDNNFTINTSTATLTLPTLTPNSNAMVLAAQRSVLRVQTATSVELELETNTRLLQSSILRLHLSKFLFTEVPDTHLTCQLDASSKLCSLEESSDDFLIVQMEIECPGGICLDYHIFSITVNGLNNRQSTARGALPYHEVFFETFEPTGIYQVDFSGYMEFAEELTPGSVTLVQNSIKLSENQVGQYTDFTFSLEYEGLQTHQDDMIQVNFINPGQLFSKGNSAQVKANDMNFFEQSVLLADSDGFVSSIQTPVPATTQIVKITLTNVINLGRVEALSSELQIFLNCDQGGQIAYGVSQIVDLDILSPVLFREVSVERQKQDLATPTDIQVSIELKTIAILPGSVLELFIPKQHLDLNGAGNSGQCKLASGSQSNWTPCQVDTTVMDGYYFLRTDPIMVGQKGSTMSLSIINIFANPGQVTFSNASIMLNVKNEGFAIGETGSGSRIFVDPPLSKEELSNVGIGQEGLITGQPTQMTLSFELKNIVSDNSVVILSLPDELLLFDKESMMECDARSERDSSSVDCDVIGFPASSSKRQQRPRYVAEIRLYPNTSNVKNFLEKGYLSEIILTNAINADFVKDRKQSTKAIQISIVSQNGFVMAQDSIFESNLPNLTPASLLSATMNRDSTKVGESQVTYELGFSTPVLIQSGAYGLLTIPKNEIRLSQDEFDCEEARSKNNLDCQVVDTTETDFIVKISDLCWYQYCLAGEQIAWHLRLSNSNSLIFEEESTSIALQLFTRNDEPIQTLTNPVMIGPPLEGSRISNFEMERRHNLIGGIDYLKFYVPPLQVTIFTETNLVLELPNGIAYYVGDEMVCTRELETGKKVELQCEGVGFSDGSGDEVLRSVRILSLCGQFHVCFENEPLIFEIEVRNPSTNEQPPNSLTYVKLILRQEIGLDLGSGQRQIQLPPMLSNSVQVTMAPLQFDDDDDCHKTGAICHLLVNVTTSNTLKGENTGAYMEVKIPSEFQVQGNKCWATIQQKTELGCFMISRDTINVRAPRSKVSAIKEAGNMINVILANVRMPVSTAPARNPTVQSMELLPTSTGSRVFSLIDTNIGDPGFTQITTEPNSFKSVEVLRQNSDISSLSSLRLTVQAFHEEALNMSPGQENNLLLEISIPHSAGQLLKERCYSGFEEVVKDSCETTEFGSTHDTLLVGDLSDFCPEYALYCRIYLWDFVNADYSILDKDSLRDSFTFTLFYLLPDGSRALIYSDTEGDIFAEPTLEPLKISVSSFTITPSGSQTAQEISLAMGLESDRGDVFSSPYLLTKFAPETYQPMFSFMHKPKAYINDVETQFRTIETEDMDLDTSITALYIDIPSNLPSTKSIQVRFTGFKNPNYVDESILTGMVEVQILGSSLGRWQVRAVVEHTFDSNLTPSQFDSLAVFSTKPWPTEQTYLEVDLSMTNQITNENVYEVEIELAEDFIIQDEELKCSNLFTAVSLPCKKQLSGNGNKVLVELTSTRQTNSLLSFMAANFKIGPITNPDRLTESDKVILRVLQSSSNKIYVEGSHPIAVKEKADQATCPNGCAECAVDGSCVACQKPSATPLLEVLTSECHSICPQGSFQSGARCLKCNQECSTCHSLDQCSSCFKDDDKIFVDGRCLNECPENTSQAFQTEAICVRQEPEQPTDGDSDQSGEEIPIFQVDWVVENLSPCDSKNCEACGLSSEFCTMCNPGFTRSDGQCLSECAEGFFSTDGICFKCSPMCKSCSETANRCDSCHEEGDDFAFNKFLIGQRLCASVCPPGTFDGSGNVCTECNDSCNTCSGASTDQCTSCFHSKATKHDLYFVESQMSPGDQQGTCEEGCPSFTEKDYLMHSCKTIIGDVFSIESWPMIMLIVAITGPLCLLCLSRLISGQVDEPFEVSSALFSMAESAVKCAFWVSLWQSQHLLLFCTTGVSMLCSALLSIIFYESTFLPVREALDEKRLSKGVETSSKGQVWAMRAVRLLAYLSSIHTMRLLSSAFCGIKALRVDFAHESPCFYLKRRVQANKAQIALTTIWSGAAIASMFTSALTATAVGAAITSIIVSLISLGHQVKLHLQDKSQSSGYRSLQTHD